MENLAFKNITLNSFENIKKESLLFDQIFFDERVFQDYLNLVKIYSSIIERKELELNQKLSYLQSEVDYLVKIGFLVPISHPIESTDKKIEIKENDVKNQMVENFNSLKGEIYKVQYGYLNPEQQAVPKLKSLIEKVDNLGDISARVHSISNYNGNSYVPIVNNPKLSLNKESLTNHEVVEIVLKNIPVPDGMVSWEKIFDFKSNNDNIHRLKLLRLWLNNSIEEKVKPDIFEKEIEVLIQEYENRFKIEKMRYRIEQYELLYSIPLEVLENFVKLNWSKIPKLFFEMKKKKIDLMISETEIKGREISFLSKIKPLFDETAGNNS